MMRRGILPTLAALFLGGAMAAGTAVARTVPGEPLPEPARAELAVSAADQPSLCPGPQTLLAPAGSRPAPPAGPVVMAAAAGSGASLGGLAVPEDGQSPEPVDPVRLAPGVPDGVGVLQQGLTVAGGRLLVPDRAPAGGSAAPVTAVQAGLAAAGDLRGLTALACPSAATRSWLVGGSTRDAEQTRLVLSNPTAAPALLDVIVHGPQGVVPAPAGEGIVVAPGAQVALFMGALAPGLDALAVEVSARSGRVAASLQHSRLLGFTPGGVADVSPAADPAPVQRVPGVVVAAPGRAAVRVVVPGRDEAVVRVQVLTDDRSTANEGTDGDSDIRRVEPAPIVVTVPGGAVQDVPLTGLPDGRYAVEVTSDLPILAGASSTVTLPGGELAGTAAAVGRTVPPTDLAWASSVPQLSGTVAVAVPRFAAPAPPVTAGLVLAAARDTLRLQLREVSTAGVVASPVPLTLVAGQVLHRDLAADTAAVLVQHRPGGSPATAPGGVLVGALELRAASDPGPLLAVVPLRAGPAAAVRGPVAVQAPRIGLP